MYGINLLEVAKILGATATSSIIFNKHGLIRSIHQEIIRYSAQQNIDMVKAMMRTLTRQDEQAYNEVVGILQTHFTEKELQEILPQ